MTDSSANALPSATVHLIFSVAGYAAARPRSGSTDTWVLIGDGVYALAGIAERKDDDPAPVLHVVADDLAQRGISVPDAAESVVLIDDLTMVDLVSAGHHTVSWR